MQGSQALFRTFGLACLMVVGVGAMAAPPVAKPKLPVRSDSVPVRVDYDRDVRPILSENCFKCHGFDPNQRQAGLRLDTPEGASGVLASGGHAVVAGKPGASVLMQRVLAGGALHMPPVSTGKKLTSVQIAVLKQWIAQGGKYDAHWSFVPPKRPALPPVRNAAWGKNPIDRFILARLDQERLKPSPEADRITLIRRMSFDLTGLPPTPAEVDAFVKDTSKDAYEKLVDRLLASPHYGERMAVSWLDLARYADTHGFHIDSQRDMWRWREWVIGAYNTNLSYDQFVTQQLAGDLLPNATLDQRIASGFNRNHPIDFEGGAIPEEYATAYIVDRIDTTATAFMGLTMRCAQCHDHKYDPITQKDYYRFFALFHNITEQGLDGQAGNAVPYIKAPDAAQQAQLAAADQKLTAAQQALKARSAEVQPALAAWMQTMSANPDALAPVTNGLVAYYRLNEGTGAELHDTTGTIQTVALTGKAAWSAGRFGPVLALDGNTTADLGSKIGFERTDKFSYGAWVNPASADAMTVLSRMNDSADFRGFDLYISGGQVFVHLIHAWEKNAIRVNTKPILEANKWTHIFVTYDGSSKAKGITIYVNGKPMPLDITHDALTDSIQTTVPLRIGRRNAAAPFKGMIEAIRIYRRQVSADEVRQISDYDTLRQILAMPDAKRTPEQRTQLTTYYLNTQDEPYRRLNADVAAAQSSRDMIDKAIPTTMVMQEMDKPRDTFILQRGQYDKPGEKVTAGTPDFLPSLPAGPVNRLTMARWLVDPSHPLTARVAVNRYWQMLFGTGLVKTAEDFGTQGERPSHPELFDWLATEYIRTGWDTKAMLRLIVTSATYRQSSKVSRALEERDPENRLLAHGARFRLQAEFVRDQALAISGLLVDKIGGPSVHPYQPAGLWEELAFGGGFSAQTYVQDHGENLYRRGMYTFWKRTCPPPSLQAFDAPEREFCLVRRSVTNTPLQALTLMNDPTYIEASRKFAERIMKEGGATPEQRISYAYRLAMGRSAKPNEIETMLGLFNQQAVVFRLDPPGAKKLLSVGESPRDASLDTAELAAWTTVASVLLNLDETITKG
ncbi:MAG: Planctomycete cytochrome [Chthonomonadaceae bacterium]|nr:Planctomycete cytochrome [Chthonomonadaceae bacterium]